MREPSLNEYFTLTNDFVLNMIFHSYPTELDPITGNIRKIHINPAVIDCEQSITTTGIANESILIGIQIITAYRSLRRRIKELVIDLLYQAVHKKVRKVESYSVFTFVDAPLPQPSWRLWKALSCTDLGLYTIENDKIDLKIIPLPTADELFQLPLSDQDQYRWFHQASPARIFKRGL